MKERVKQHWNENKDRYAIAGACLAAGVGVGFVASQQQIVLADMFNIKVKSPTTTITQLTRRGHPGYVIRDNETGEVFASISRAADVMGISKSNIIRQLQGKQATAGGHTFSNLGECPASQ